MFMCLSDPSGRFLRLQRKEGVPWAGRDCIESQFILQIRTERLLVQDGFNPAQQFGHLMQRLIDHPEFQRLRHIRQTGLN